MQRNASAPQLAASSAETKLQAVHTAICTRLLLINAWAQTVTALVATITLRAAVPIATYIRGDIRTVAAIGKENSSLFHVSSGGASRPLVIELKIKYYKDAKRGLDSYTSTLKKLISIDPKIYYDLDYFGRIAPCAYCVRSCFQCT